MRVPLFASLLSTCPNQRRRPLRITSSIGASCSMRRNIFCNTYHIHIVTTHEGVLWTLSIVASAPLVSGHDTAIDDHDPRYLKTTGIRVQLYPNLSAVHNIGLVELFANISCLSPQSFRTGTRCFNSLSICKLKRAVGCMSVAP